MTERRKFLRFDTALNAICEIVSEQWKAVSKIENISKEGALLLMPKTLEQGSELKLSMDVPGDNVPIFASCKVAWQSTPRKREENASYETGVKFTEIDNHDRGRLLEFIYSQWLKVLDRE